MAVVDSKAIGAALERMLRERQEAAERLTESQRRAIADHEREQHRCPWCSPVCPQCGGGAVEVTTKGILVGPDTNHATCQECGWAGPAEELER